MVNTLYYGDNLGYLREMDRESVNLVYLDPPFNSKANYNLLFRSPQGDAVEAQTTAFKDTWKWDFPAERCFEQALTSGSPAGGMLRAFRSYLGESDLMAYLAMMTPRLIEMHRVLKPDGSLYLHCDPTASHYLKLILDGVFGADNYRNEVTWKRTAAHGDARTWSRVSDTIFFYTKSRNFTWNIPREPHSSEYLSSHYASKDSNGRAFQLTSILSPSPRPNMMYEWKGFPYPPMGWRYSKDTMASLDAQGLIYYPTHADGSYDTSKRPRFKRYLDEQAGNVITTVWTDISPVNARAQERIGYPTQKPTALLKRIIEASSNPGHVVLDPFCGCGTTVEAAQSTDRAWIGVDITHHAIDVIEGRLRSRYPGCSYEVKGRPEDLGAALRLARDAPYEFQWWANWMLGVQNYRERKKGPDKGVDGIIYFHNVPQGVGQVVVSVKAGQNIGPAMIDALAGTVQGEGAQLGVFVCVVEPTDAMRQRAARQGFVRVGKEQYPKIQIVTAAELLAGRALELPRPIEAEAFTQPLRPVRTRRVAPPTPQLSLALPIMGGRRGVSRDGTQDHLSGSLLGRIAVNE